ncbi:MAG TPA: hypothetical protein VEW74_02210 [Candidatus Nitrosotalea sp.]|nr:hypothetical protein [Candidatus Nitrosotalea sp.]
MKHARISLTLGAALAIAGCQGSANLSSSALPQTAVRPIALHPQHQSWMAPNVAGQDLLYVSNGNGEVTVYRYWQHTLVGVLTDFTEPLGECADGSGNVYIADYAAEKILEYSHGGKKPIKTLDDAPDSPYACSVDPTTGNLAVANNDGTSTQGNIAIWQKASGSPTHYTDSKIDNFVGCAYDGNGTLFVANVYVYGVGTFFAWLPKNGSKLVDVTVPSPDPSRGGWGYVTGIQWDGKYFAIDAYNIYRISLIHGQAYYVGSSQLGSGDPFWIYNNTPGQQGTQVVGGVNGNSGSRVDYWHYPAGGSPIYSLSHGVDKPFGVTISLKAQRP